MRWLTKDCWNQMPTKYNLIYRFNSMCEMVHQKVLFTYISQVYYNTGFTGYIIYLNIITKSVTVYTKAHNAYIPDINSCNVQA